ncbi:MAG: type II toxin-antitoxin system prevent-host-death family antitoxin [Acidobacteria bacterium]|nr:MAG: type II toxin-antitoxin system prevent-host-death family antitoxin [Acidobacteriota bacterium]
MTTVGAYEAKTHLSDLLMRVEKGESIVITRHGTPIAELRPITGRDSEAIAAAIGHIKDFRSRHPVDTDEVRQMISEGRRH